MEDETFREEYVDNFSDVPSDVEDNEDSESDGRENIDHSTEEEDSFPQPRRNPREFRKSTSSDEEESDDLSKDWSNIDTPRVQEIFEGATGPRVNVTECDKVENVVNCFIGDDLLDFITVETNKYRAQNHHKFKVGKKCGNWRDVTISELKKFFGLVIIMGLVKKSSINDYWSTNPFTETPIFSKTMSRNRFRQILLYLHFSDNEKMPPNADRLYKVQHLIDYFSKKFEENFAPGRNISIDEGIIPWRGRHNFKDYNPRKITKYGLLVRMACDSITGYILSSKLYSGAGQKIERTVMDLLKNYLNKWHHIYMDNLCNSVALARKLLLDKIRLCGTIRVYRGLSDFLKKAKIMETKFARQGEILLQLFKTNKRRDIRMISTIHNANICDSRKKDKKGNAILKPKCIIDYNQFMKRVDRVGQYLSYYPIYGKTKKWTKKVSLYLINCAIFNSFLVYEHLNTDPIKKLNYQDFLLQLASAWITTNDSVPTTSRVVRSDPAERLDGGIKHQLVKISLIKKGVRRDCRVCYANKIRKPTYFMCKNCQVPLHVGECFNNYHTKKKY